jgi:hypothetical protein
MRSTLAALLGFLTIVLASAASGGQTRLSAADVARLAGTWELDTSGNASIPAERRVITISPEWLRLEIRRAEDAHPPLLTYRFDRQETVSAFGSGKATARLLDESAELTTETIFEIRDSPMTVRETFKLGADGTELTVTTTMRVEHGYQGVLPAGETKPPNVANTTRVFRKQP